MVLEQWVYASHNQLRPFEDMVGTIEGTVGNEVLVRFGEAVVPVAAEMVEVADELQGR